MNENNIRFLLPVGYEAYSAIAKNIQIFNNDSLPLPELGSFEIAASKSATVSLANELNIPAPISIKLNKISDLQEIKLSYPLVVKGIFSSGFVKYANNYQELEYWVKEITKLQKELPLLQEYISGEGTRAT